MSKPDQIAHRAREVSMAKTSLLRVVVSNRVSSSKMDIRADNTPQGKAGIKIK